MVKHLAYIQQVLGPNVSWYDCPETTQKLQMHFEHSILIGLVSDTLEHLYFETFLTD
jgi:hypothetical protein